MSFRRRGRSLSALRLMLKTCLHTLAVVKGSFEVRMYNAIERETTKD